MLKPQRLLLQSGSPPNRLLTSAAKAKNAPSLASLSDAAAEALILAASDAVSNFCSLPSVGGAPPTFARQTIIEKLIFPRDPAPTLPLSLYLAHHPLTLSALSIDGAAIDPATLFVTNAGEVIHLASADYRYWPSDVLIQATYDAGYVTAAQAALPTPPAGPEMPADLERAVIATAQSIYSLQAREQFDVASVEETDNDAGSMKTRYFDAGRTSSVPGEAAAHLAAYRRLC